MSFICFENTLVFFVSTIGPNSVILDILNAGRELVHDMYLSTGGGGSKGVKSRDLGVTTFEIFQVSKRTH